MLFQRNKSIIYPQFLVSGELLLMVPQMSFLIKSKLQAHSGPSMKNGDRRQKNLIRDISSDTAKEFHVTVDLKIVDGYPVLFNNEKLTDAAVKLSSELLGKNNVELFDIRMSSDDFSYFSREFPSLYFRTGIKKVGKR